MGVYENIDSVALEELLDSYFADSLKSIIICIKSLQDIGLIEYNCLIDLVNDLSCSIVFDIIKNIKFNSIKNDNIKSKYNIVNLVVVNKKVKNLINFFIYYFLF